MRLLLAASTSGTLDLMQFMLASVRQILPFDMTVSEARQRDEVLSRAQQNLDEVVLLDWQLAGADTPDVVRSLLDVNRDLRIMTLLPLEFKEYRRCVWDAGGCTSIPMERLDEEWLASALCLINRAMQREQRLRQELAAR